ncbi:hypothetical protein J437_LFUL002789 [Ladona fulva]|uniref:Ig-like domain-containing protein n=1 Tax=Ladona fulva TaxID=123851 RepID=A0A8K0JUF1_LADFU|nr:hypothetical protein J437_LFUL002789 [Ladona fulva]
MHFKTHSVALLKICIAARNFIITSRVEPLNRKLPPEHPVVFDRNGRPLTTSAGPYNEGDDVVLNCRVEGVKFEFSHINADMIFSLAVYKC